jgi:hypothetical protein
MAWVEIKDTEPLSLGDRIKLVFRSPGNTLLRAAQIMLIEKRLEQKFDGFDVVYWEYAGPEIAVELRITEPEKPERYTAGIVTPAVIITALLTVVGPITFYLTTTGIFKQIESSPTTQTAIKGGAAAAVAAALVVLGIIAKR